MEYIYKIKVKMFGKRFYQFGELRFLKKIYGLQFENIDELLKF